MISSPKGTLAKTGVGVHTIHDFVLSKVFLVFSQAQNSCFGWFHAISLPKGTLAKTGVGVHTTHDFVLPKVFLVFFAMNTPNLLLKAQNSCFRWFQAIS